MPGLYSAGTRTWALDMPGRHSTNSYIPSTNFTFLRVKKATVKQNKTELCLGVWGHPGLCSELETSLGYRGDRVTEIKDRVNHVTALGVLRRWRGGDWQKGF